MTQSNDARVEAAANLKEALRLMLHYVENPSHEISDYVVREDVQKARDALAAADAVRPSESEDEVERVRKALGIKHLELQKCLIRESRIMQILTKIIMLLPPKPIEKDGAIYEYKDPDPQKILNMLRDKVNSIVEDVGKAIDSPEAAISAMKAVQSVGGWLPIETAPKDGMPVLVWWPEEYHHPFVAFWADKWEPSGIGWKWMGWGEVKNHSQPTAWQPLPTAPSQTSGGEG